MENEGYLGTLLYLEEDGSIKIPQTHLDAAGLVAECRVEVYSSADGIFIALAEGRCTLCNRNGKLKKINTSAICNHCEDDFKNKLRIEIEAQLREEFEEKKGTRVK